MLALVVTAGLGGCADDPPCEQGETRESTVVCGMNDEGVFLESCGGGVWLVVAECTGTDECVIGTTRPGSEVCGLNNEGVRLQECPDGTWIDSTECTGTDICVNGTEQLGSAPCGLNEEGVLVQDCVDGDWQDSTRCSGTDICVNGDERESAVACGLNDEGVFLEACTSGTWLVTAQCTGTDVCANGTEQTGSTPCGLNGQGNFTQTCTDGTWLDDAQCIDPDVCVNGTEEPIACGDAARGIRTCIEGAWESSGCWTFHYLGEGECRQGNGQYPVKFVKIYLDLGPHTSGDNAEVAQERCEQKCFQHREWCLAVQVTLRDDWPFPECGLVTDTASFIGAGYSFDNPVWEGNQTIDGEVFTTQCSVGESGGCMTRVWGGGSLFSRAGYHCFTLTEE